LHADFGDFWTEKYGTAADEAEGADKDRWDFSIRDICVIRGEKAWRPLRLAPPHRFPS
jgi:hypothetical protein